MKGHLKSRCNIFPIHSFQAVHNITRLSVSAITWTCAWDCAIQNESDYGRSEWLCWRQNRGEERDRNLQHCLSLLHTADRRVQSKITPVVSSLVE